MKRANQNEAQNEGRKGQNQSSSSLMSVDQTPIDQTPIDQTPIDQTPIDQTPEPVPPKKSNFMKEVESLGIQSLDIPRGLDASELHMTRQKARKLQRISEKQPVFDKKESGHKPDNTNKRTSAGPKRSQTAAKSEVVGAQFDPPNGAALKSILSEKRAEGLIKWEMWQQRKEKITNILQSRHYSTVFAPPEDVMIGINDGLEDFHMSIQDGLHIFRPTADVLNDFEKFLHKVEDIAGQETGVVKVIIPKELLLPPDNSAGFVDHPAGSHGQKPWGQSIENLLAVAYLTKLDLRVSELQYLPIYDVHMMGGLLLELYEKDKNYPGDIFSEVRFAKDCEEEKMVECGAHSTNDRYYSADIEASNEKRNALDCGKLNMKEFHSHGLDGAQTDKDKIHQPKLQIAGIFGSSFGLQMTSFGGYSLNVLHSGAPKCWTVIKPVDHQKIEFQLHPDAEKASLRGKRIKFVRLTSVDFDGNAYTKNQKKLESFPCDFPPRCDLFLNHQPFYIPKGSLEACGVGFTQLVQYEGELIISFPFAYYQGYSCGPSIAEEVGYTNERSDTLNQEGLYYHCHAACTGPKPPIDFGAFPTAAASDAKRMEKTIIPMPPNDGGNCRAKASITSLKTVMEKTIGDDAMTPRSEGLQGIVPDRMLDPSSSTLEDKELGREASGDKQGNQGMKLGSTRRRRLVRASDLPGYKG